MKGQPMLFPELERPRAKPRVMMRILDVQPRRRMSSSFTIEMRPPPKAVRPNARVHHMARARAVKHYRTVARLLATHAMRGHRPPGWLKARAHVVAYHATGNRMDPDNLIASLKPAFDGIADSGMISNDRGLWPERPEMLRGSPARVVITISEEAE